MGEKVQGISSTNGRYKIDRGRVRIVREKELTCTTHGHELRWGECRWEGVCRADGE